MGRARATSAAADPARALHAALLDFHRSPGRHNLAARQPALLFASLREVLLLASDRGARAAADDLLGPELREAAAFFLRTALFQPGASHYALLGLDPAASAAEVKERYRMLMRLVHPDFSAGTTWPADAAARLNEAYDVLATPGKRRDYDAMQREAGPTPAVAPRPLHHAGAQRPRRSSHRTPRQLKIMTFAFGVAGAGLLAGALLTGPSSEAVQLVQRPGAATRAPGPGGPAPAELAAWDAPQRLWASLDLGSTKSDTLLAQVQPVSTPASAARAAPPSAALAPPPAPAPAAAAATEPARAPTEEAPPAAPPRPPRPLADAPSLAEVQPQLASVLQYIESGRGDVLLRLLERDARQSTSARALADRLDRIAGGNAPLRLSNVELRAQPTADRLFVTGRMICSTDGADSGKAFSLRAEFVNRAGQPVLVGLSPAEGQ